MCVRHRQRIAIGISSAVQQVNRIGGAVLALTRIGDGGNTRCFIDRLFRLGCCFRCRFNLGFRLRLHLLLRSRFGFGLRRNRVDDGVDRIIGRSDGLVFNIFNRRFFDCLDDFLNNLLDERFFFRRCGRFNLFRHFGLDDGFRRLGLHAPLLRHAIFLVCRLFDLRLNNGLFDWSVVNRLRFSRRRGIGCRGGGFLRRAVISFRFG